ncbi:hypothetical protein P8C59_003071 [Phyllachora maydis]|uniref:Reverse transcriptase Ty1/copia-type domain-containing protein n=1 Tax=Phyllachora maydis TaxID=1825666 RepID=A0AAD9I0V3_9PEZI|nr:hypothetical protein P8C59_003071 [Phyllachora maydis]
MHLLGRSCRQSSRPLLPIRTLLEDKEDSEDYSEVIEVLKQYIKSYKRDSVSAINVISSTLASLTNSSNAATTRKTSHSPRFDPFSGTIDLDSPLCPSKKEPYLGPAIDNIATSNLDPPIDIGSKEGFKDTITSSIVKELSKKAYTIPNDSKLSRESNFEYIADPIESKKEDVYNEFHVLTFSTYKTGLSAFNVELNGYLAKLTIAKIDIDPSLILNYLNIEYLMADILEESRNPAIEAYRAAYVANSSNSTPNSNSNPSKKGKNKKKGKKKASYNVKGQNDSAKSTKQASFMLGSYNLAIEEEKEESDSRSTDYISNSKERFTTFTPNTGQLRPINTGNSPISPASIGSIILEVLSRKAPPTYTKLVLDNVLYLPNININIVSWVRHYDSGGCLIKETLYGGSSKPILHANFASPLGLTSFNTTKSRELQRNKIVVEIPSDSIRKEDYRPIIEDAIVSKAMEPKKRYKLRNSLAKGTTLEGIGPSLREKRPCLEEELVDLDLDLEGAVSLDPSNLNTEKPISIEIGPSKLEPYESSSDSELDEPLLDKPINPVIVESTRPTISIRKPKLQEASSKTIKPIFTLKPIEVIAPNQPITNEPLDNSNLILEGDKMQLDYYKLLAKTSSYILEEIYMEIPKGLLDLAASNKAIYKLLLKYSYNPSTPNIIKLSKALYSLKQSPREWQDKLKILLKSLGYLPLILDLRVFYNTKTCYFIVLYIDDCLFIRPDIGYITDLKNWLNKVDAMKDLGPAAYFLGWLSRSLNRPTKSYLNAAKNLFKYLNSTKDYSICFSYNGNIVANLGPKLSNSSNTTTKLSRDLHSKEGPRPLTTTSTTIVDSRNGKGSSRTSIINSSLVPIGFSDSDFTGDKATSKSTYGYLYKLASRPIS